MWRWGGLAGWASVRGLVGVRKKGETGSADVVQGAASSPPPPGIPTPTHSVQSVPLAGRREDRLGEHLWAGWGKGLLGQVISLPYLSSLLLKSLGGVGRQGMGGESEEEGLGVR